MTTSPRIVCAVDFSPHGAVALAQALVLADRRQAQLDALYIAPSRRTPDDDAELRVRLEAWVAEVNVASVPTSVFVLEGRPVGAIVRHVAARPADLLVIGPTPRALFRSRGRFVAAVARRASCPVLALPQAAPADGVQPQFQRIVCAVDDSLASAGALQMALRFAQESGGRLTVLHVVEEFPQDVYSAASVSRLLEDFDARGHEVMRHARALLPPFTPHWRDVDYRVVPGTARKTIVSVAAAEAADLVIVGRRREHWLGVLSTTAAGVIARSTCPVLTIPGPAGPLSAASRLEAVSAVEAIRPVPVRPQLRPGRSQQASVVSIAEARAWRLQRQGAGTVVNAMPDRRRDRTAAGQAR
jgi:nucleotide-binding universal stress UspA family protein